MITRAHASSAVFVFRLLLAAGVAAFAPALRASLEWAPAATRLDQRVSLPAEMVNGVLLVEATINGAGPFRLLVDSGCSASIISPAVAVAADVRTSEDPLYVETVNSLATPGLVPYVTLDTLELGGARFEGVAAGVVSLELQSKIAGVRIDGILGYSVFSEVFLTLDFPHRRVQLSSTFPQDLPPVRSEVPVKEISAVPYVTVNFQGHDFDLMLDTGANGSLELDVDAAARLDWKVEPRPAGLVAAVGSTGRDWLGRLSGEATLGRITQPEPIISVGRGGARIGTAFLRTLCVVISRAQDTVWFCADSTAPLPSPAKRSVGLSLLADSAGWRVAGTIPESPAEKAAVAPGDLVAAIEDRPAPQWSRDEIQQWLDQHDALTVSITNASGTRRLQLPVWSLVP